jgi:hypothetical protein
VCVCARAYVHVCMYVYTYVCHFFTVERQVSEKSILFCVILVHQQVDSITIFVCYLVVLML